jgi:hypothetical protein
VSRCLNCGRNEEIVGITKHHCIPQVKGGKKGPVMDLCSDCHGQIHVLYTPNHLRDLLNTPELVVADEQMRKFGKYARKQNGRIKKREGKERRRKRRVN